VVMGPPKKRKELVRRRDDKKKVLGIGREIKKEKRVKKSGICNLKRGEEHTTRRAKFEKDSKTPQPGGGGVRW